MGRKALYLTIAERQSAERAWKARYAASTRCIAKRHCQNSRVYRKRYGRHASKSSLSDHTKALSVPDLPSSLISLASTPLPTSTLFHDASRSADALDESDLSIWEQEPPYAYPEPTATVHEVQYTKNLVDVMLGRRWRLSKAVRDGRALQFIDEEFLVGTLKDLTGRISRWSSVASRVAGSESGRNREMAHCWLQWQARDILTDCKEVEMLKNGENPYCTLMQTTPL
ncbi:hypothetical protein EDD15DRAFT_2376808 [Pisolithus albus]|nr:hypothetical protein EDD15DRAFT_2202517 [Pisolithus albus]KAI5983237.1 hypothetical protein EDD15DRAFT_2376808 [Pisolithus albus]